jgi:hypothetical protein
MIPSAAALGVLGILAFAFFFYLANNDPADA